MQSDQTKTIRVALYVRVSTEEQREGQTIDSQVAELEAFAHAKGWEIAGVYKDDGWSGSMLIRPELDRLRDDASRELFEAVLINDVDRLARDVSHLGIVKRDLERHNIDVVFRKLPAEKSPTYNLMVNILGSFAEFEREMIIDRTRRGRRHKVEVRKQYLGSNAPFGFRYVRKDKSSGKEGYLKLDMEEAAVARQMFEWVDKEGLSAHRVGERLSEMKVPPRKGGASWGKSSVLRILRSETYAGVWHYNKYESCEPKNGNQSGRYKRSLKCSLRKRDRSEWLPITLPDNLTIIPREQWERVQHQLDRNVTFSPRNTKHEYLLKGLVKCGGCGLRYVGDPCHGKYYYRCLARCKKFPTVKEEVLDSAVWDAVKEAILTPSIIAKQLARLYDRRSADVKQLKSEHQETEGLLKDLRKEEDRILEAYRKNILSPAQLGRELEKLQARKSFVEARKSQPLGGENVRQSASVQRSLIEYCRVAGERLKTFDSAERQQFLRTLIDEIIFEGKRVRIRGIIPILELKSQQHSNHQEEQEELTTIASSIATTALHPYARNTVFRGQIADTTLYRRNRSSGRIESIRGYRNDRNAEEFPFEISWQVPQRTILYEQIDLNWVREQVRANPLVTLKELSALIHKQFGVKPSISHMLRIQQLAGIFRIPGSREKRVETLYANSQGTPSSHSQAA